MGLASAIAPPSARSKAAPDAMMIFLFIDRLLAVLACFNALID
jgi:hypothetical protein